jgi:hypothetical protein
MVCWSLPGEWYALTPYWRMLANYDRQAVLQNSLDNLTYSYYRLLNERFVVEFEVDKTTGDLVQQAMDNVAAKMAELKLKIMDEEMGG